MVDEITARYLEDVEHTPFEPMGWLYQSVFGTLLNQGLVTRLAHGGYLISQVGRAELKLFRSKKP